VFHALSQSPATDTNSLSKAPEGLAKMGIG
jgi:hypothetical protein